MIQSILIFFALTMFVCGKSFTQEVFFKEESTEESTKYILQWSREGGVVSIWNKEVPFVGGQKPAEWCDIIRWKGSDRGLLVLVNHNDIFGSLLQFSPEGELISEMGSTWLKLIREGGEVDLLPPDGVTLTKSDGATEKLVIREGVLYTPEGSTYLEPKISRRAGQSFSSSEQESSNVVGAGLNEPSAANHADLRKGNTIDAKIVWILTTVVLVAIALIGARLKRRKKAPL